MNATSIHLGPILTPSTDQSCLFIERGALAVAADGRITDVGEATQVIPKYPDATHHTHADAIISAGFVDTHVHLAQVFARARVRGNLLDWLDEAIFPEEARLSQEEHARHAATAFVNECVASGVTTANVFLTSHKAAGQVAFEIMAQSGLRVIAGLVQMDQLAPPDLLVTSKRAILDAQELANSWHGYDNDRIQYALLPRFALSCSRELLTALGELKRARPELYVHTHLSETRRECEEVLSAFPECSDYAGVYESFGLLGENTVVAHAIHLSDHELDLLAEHGVGVAHCPSANFFLKSGVFPWDEHSRRGLRFGLGSDVGAGYQISPFQVMRDAYNMQPTTFLRPSDIFWRSTLGGAQALRVDHRTGSLEAGKDADFVILDTGNIEGVRNIVNSGQYMNDLISQFIFTADSRVVRDCFVRGVSLRCS